MMEYAKGIPAINLMSFGCSCNAIGYFITSLGAFPMDVVAPGGIRTPQMQAHQDANMQALDADIKKWKQGENYKAGSAVFCLVTKYQLGAKAVLEANGFEELGRTISSHIWPYDMQRFAKELDATEVIYLMGKGWFHQKENTCKAK
jgi:hypothetical protein